MVDPEPENDGQRIWRQAQRELGEVVEYVRSRYSLSHPDCAACFQKQVRSLERTFFSRSRPKVPGEHGGALIRAASMRGRLMDDVE